MGTIKARNSMDLTEAEDNKKRWQEHTEELYKNDLHAAQYQKNKWPNQKMSQRTKQTFLQRRHTDG